MDSDRASHGSVDDNAHLDGGSAISPPEHAPPQAACSPLRLRRKWGKDTKLRLVLDIPAPTTSSQSERRGESVHRDAVSIHPAEMSRQPEKDGLSQMLGETSTVKDLCVKYGEGDQAGVREVIRLCSRLPELEELCFRNVRGRMDYSKYFQIADSTTELPTTLKRLHVLGRGRQDPETVCRFLIHRLARFGMATGLQELSITTSDCAARVLLGYLRGLTPGPPAGEICHWPALRSLTLTSWEVGPRIINVAANRALHHAGMVALDLPGLRELRLVSYHPKRRKEIDGLFYYIVKGEGRDTAVCFGKSAQYSRQL